MKTRFLNISERTIRWITLNNSLWICYISRTTISCQWVRCLKCQIWKRWLKWLEEFLFMNIPRCRKIPRWQPTSRTATPHSISSFIAESTIQRITSVIRISSICKCSYTPISSMPHRIILFSSLNTFLKVLINIWWNLTHRILHTPSLEWRVRALKIIYFHSCKKISYMLFCK